MTKAISPVQVQHNLPATLVPPSAREQRVSEIASQIIPAADAVLDKCQEMTSTIRSVIPAQVNASLDKVCRKNLENDKDWQTFEGCFLYCVDRIFRLIDFICSISFVKGLCERFDLLQRFCSHLKGQEKKVYAMLDKLKQIYLDLRAISLFIKMIQLLVSIWTTHFKKSISAAPSQPKPKTCSTSL